MKKIIAGMVVAAALFGAAQPGSAFADPAHPLPEPGDANCHGAAVAYYNALLREFRKTGVLDVHGMGGLAVYAGISVKEVQQVITDYCDAA